MDHTTAVLHYYTPQEGAWRLEVWCSIPGALRVRAISSVDAMLAEMHAAHGHLADGHAAGGRHHRYALPPSPRPKNYRSSRGARQPILALASEGAPSRLAPANHKKT